MRKNVMKIWDLPSSGTTAALVVLAGVFFVGGFVGCIFAGQAESEGEAALSSYLEGYLSIAVSEETVRPEFFFLLWKAIRWPVFAIILGFTPIGLIGVPVLFLVRAFLLSFSISSFFRVMGLSGLFLAFFVFGIGSLVYIPILYILGIRSFLNSGLIVGRITGENRRYAGLKRSDILCCCICFVVLIICSFIEYSTGPAIIELAAEILNY